MARLWTSGAELGIAVADAYAGDVLGIPADGTLGGANLPTIDTTTFRSGARSWKCRSTTAASHISLSFGTTGTVAGRLYYLRGHFFWTATETPLVGTVLLKFTSLGVSSSSADVRVESVAGNTLSLALYLGVSGGALNKFMDLGSYVASTWHRIEMAFSSDSSVTTMRYGVRINDVDVTGGILSNSGVGGLNTGGGPTSLQIGKIDTTATTVSIWVDDAALNDDQGANQNSWPGEGKVVLLLPTADSAIGTGWTLGTGTAISGNTGKTAVANTPPLGVTDLAVGSDVKQIRNATSNANVNYDAIMTTYTAAGIATGDVITVVDPFVNTAAPLVTGAKAGTIGVVSNPVIANIALSARGTAGAFWNGTTAGAWPTGWKWSHGTPAYNPSVTKGTAPVARITQVTASTRIAMVASMGIYVEYVPAVAVKPKRYFSRATQAAVMRAAAR